MLWTVFAGHLGKDLHVRRAEWSRRHIWRDIKDHARLRFPKGAAAARYNILQKLSYIGVIFILLPLMIATGLTMSPGMNAARSEEHTSELQSLMRISYAVFCFKTKKS